MLTHVRVQATRGAGVHTLPYTHSTAEAELMHVRDHVPTPQPHSTGRQLATAHCGAITPPRAAERSQPASGAAEHAMVCHLVCSHMCCAVGKLKQDSHDLGTLTETPTKHGCHNEGTEVSCKGQERPPTSSEMCTDRGLCTGSVLGGGVSLRSVCDPRVVQGPVLQSCQIGKHTKRS